MTVRCDGREPNRVLELRTCPEWELFKKIGHETFRKKFVDGETTITSSVTEEVCQPVTIY